MKVERVFCLFEQSGPFKNAFRALGISAEDYDILDDFGQTDHRIDLFAEIEKAYAGKQSLFDDIGESDLCLAFFPCTRFQAYNCANFQGKNTGMRRWSTEQKLQHSMSLHEELHHLYMLICKLFTISLRGVADDSRESVHPTSLFDDVFPRRTESNHQGQICGRRLLQEADTVFLREL